MHVKIKKRLVYEQSIQLAFNINVLKAFMIVCIILIINTSNYYSNKHYTLKYSELIDELLTA